MVGLVASAATAAILVLGGGSPSLNAAVTVLPPEVGQCYNIPKKQFDPTTRTLGTMWPGGGLTGCRQRHRVEVFAADWIPDEYVAKSDGTQARFAGWQCRKAQMRHGPLTRLNGFAVNWYLVDATTPDGRQGRRYACLTAMSGKHPGSSVRSTKPFSRSDDTGSICVTFKAQSGDWSPCRKGSYQLTVFKLLDPTFQANFPGVKAADRRASRACKRYPVWFSPPSTVFWNDYPFADCYQKI